MLEPIDYKDLIGKPYIPEENDCYQLIRKYYAKLGIELRDYAHPSDWMLFDANLYLKHYKDENFKLITTEDWTPQLHDVMMVQGSVSTSNPTHAGILCDYNKVIHHYNGRFSEVTRFGHPWRRPALVFRSNDVIVPDQVMKEVVLEDLMPRHIRQKFIEGITGKPSGEV